MVYIYIYSLPLVFTTQYFHKRKTTCRVSLTSDVNQCVIWLIRLLIGMNLSVLLSLTAPSAKLFYSLLVHFEWTCAKSGLKCFFSCHLFDASVKMILQWISSKMQLKNFSYEGHLYLLHMGNVVCQSHQSSYHLLLKDFTYWRTDGCSFAIQWWDFSQDSLSSSSSGNFSLLH